MLKLIKKINYIVLVLVFLNGCENTNTNSSKNIEETNASSSSSVKPETEKLSEELKVLRTDKTVYSINSHNYEADSLPEEYIKASGKQRKAFLDLYIKYQITLNYLEGEYRVYKDKINKILESEMQKIKYRGIEQNSLDKLLYTQKLTLEKIALEEVSKSEQNLTQKITHFYQSNKEKFKYPNTIELSLIVFNEKEIAKTILDNLIEINDLTINTFAAQASKHSIDPLTRLNNGYAGYMTEETAGNKLFNEIWKMNRTGLLKQVFQKDQKFLLVYVHKLMKSNIKSFQESKDEIRTELLKSKRNLWIKTKYNEVARKTKIEIYDDFKYNEMTLN